MAIRADVPGMGAMYFPEGMSEDEIYARIDQEKSRLAAARETATGGMPSLGARSRTASADMSPTQREILDTIAGTEAPDYNTLYGGRKVADLSRHPGIDVPIQSGPNVGKTSSAFGRYQFIEPTWNEEAQRLGLKDMSPASQDAAAWDLASRTYKQNTGGDLEADWASGDPAAKRAALGALSKVWTSLPGGVEQAKRYGSRAATQDPYKALSEYRFDPRELPTGDILTGALHRGMEGLKGTMFDLVPALGASIIGKDEYAREQLGEYQKRMESAEEEFPTAFKSYKDIEGIGHAFDYGVETIGENGADIVAFMLGAGAGSAAFKRGAIKAFEGQVEKHLAKDKFKDLTLEQKDELKERLTDRLLEGATGKVAKDKAADLGSTVGAGLVSEAINAPETFQQVYEDTGELRPDIAMGMGTLSAALDTIVPKQIFNSLTGAQKEAFKAALINQSEVVPQSFKRLFFTETSKLLAEEGATEATQQVINNLASDFAGANKDLMEGVIDSFLKGAIGGAAYGGPGAALEAGRRKGMVEEEIQSREFQKETARQQEQERVNQELQGLQQRQQQYQEQRQQEREAAYQQGLATGPEAETKLLPPPRMGVTEGGDVLGTAEQRAEYEASLAAAQSQQQRQRDLLGQQGITYPPGSDISQYAQQKAEPYQLDMFPAEKAAAEGAARRGIAPYATPTIEEIPEAKPSTVIEASRLRELGLTPQSGFFKELVGKDLSKPRDLNAVKKIISKVQQNPILAQSTKDGVRNLFTQMLPEYGKQGEIFTPKGRVKKGVTGARPISRTIDTGVGAGPQIPSGPGGGVPTGGVGVPDESGVGVTQPLPPQAGAGEAREQPALAPDLQYPELPAVPAGGRNVLYGNKAELRKYIDTLRKALSEGRIDKQTHDSLRAKADNGLKELDDLNNSPEHKSASFANTLAEMNTNGKVVWNGGLIHLIQFTDSHGNIQYKATKGDNILSPTLEQMEPFDPNSKVTPEEAFQLYAARDAIEADETAKHDKTPFVKFNKDGLAFSSNIPDGIRGVMTEWKNMLGLDVPLYVGFLSDAKRDADLFTGPHRTVGKLALIKKNARGFTKGMEDGSRMIILDQDKSLLANLEILAHEMGHVFEKEVFKNADPQIKREIRDEFDKWYYANKGKTPKQFIKSLRARKVAKQSTAPDAGVAEHEMPKFHDYFSTFGEWFADQVSRWATTSDAPVSAVEKFFHRLGQAIKRFYAALTNQGYLPSAPVKKYLDGIAAQVKQENKNPPSDTDLRDFLGDMEVQEMSRDSGPESINEKIALPTKFEGVDGPFKAASGMSRVIKKIPFFNKEQSAAVAGTLDKLGKGWDSLYMSLLPGYALSDLASRYFPKGIAERYHKEIINHDGFIHTYATNVLEPITNIFRRAMDTNRKQQPIFNKMVDLSTKFQVDPTDKNSILNATKFSMGYITFDGEGNQVGREVKYFNTAAERDQAIKDHNKGKPREERAFRVTDPDVGVKTEAVRIKGMYDQLKPEWQLLYRTMKNANVKTYELLRNTLSERIDTHELDPTAKIILKKDIFTRLAESGMINPYFALTREGDNWLSAEVPNKYGVYESVTTAFTDPLSREKFATDLKNVVYKFEREKGASHEDAMDTATQRVRSYSRIDEINYRDLPSSSAINSIFKIIDSKRPQQGANESAEDFRARMEQYDTIEKDIMQMVIKAMPETSILKSLHRRENTPGNSLDAMGSFERKQRSMVRQISNLKYRPRIRKSMEDMASYADMLGRGQDEVRDSETGEVVQRRVLPKDNDKQVRFLSAFRDHSKYVLNPTPSDLAGITKSAIFGGTMAFNPSSAIIELSNIPMIVYPYLGAEYGMSTSRKALQNAHKLFKRSGNSRMMTPYGSENESDIKAEKLRSGWSVGNYDKDSKEGKHYAPLVELMASTGMLNRSQLYENLLSSSRTSLMDKWNAAAGWMLHTTSRHNREVAAMATYDLELAKLKKRGVPDAQARELAASKAINVTEMTNGSVASADAPRFAHNWIGSIVLMYKRFGIANMYMQMKMVREAYMNPPERLPHESAEEYQAKVKQFRQEAEIMKKRFARLQLTTALFSGIHGLPMYGAAAFLYNMFKDDDEDDADTVVRKGIGDMFFNGPLEYYSGISLASRMGLSGLIFKEPRSSGDTSSFSQMMVDSLGGPLPGMVDKIENGINMIQNGNVERGIEAIAPAFLANLMKGTRYMVTGKAETLRGDPIYDDINPLHGAIQLLGFAPAEVQKRQEFNAKQMGLAKAEAAKDSNLKGRYYKAYREHDYVGMREAREALLEFGKKHPHLKYTPGTVDGVLRKSVKRHDQATKDMIMGKSYSAKRRPVVLEAMDDLDIEE